MDAKQIVDPNTVLYDSVTATRSGKDEEHPKFGVGQKVKLVKDVVNDGTYPHAPIGTLMMKEGSIGYIKSIPIELDEAAKVDGCGPWTTFWKVIFPLLAPINATIGILTALWAWNDFMLPLILLGDPNNMTLPLVQYIFKTKFGVDYNLAFASYMMALTPMILVYVVAQKWIISNITSGAVKS